MAKSGCLLVLEQSSWQILCERASGDAETVRFAPTDFLDQPKLIAQSLKEHGLANNPFVIGISAEQCLAVTVPVGSPQLLRKRMAMRYHLEEWIPWSAEDYVVDYASHQGRAFMVAAKIEPLVNFLRALEELDIEVVSICPTAVLAAAEFLLQAENIPQEYILAWCSESQAELFTIENRQLAGWTRCSATAPDVAREVRALCLASGTERPLVLLDNSSSLDEDLRNTGVEIQTQAGECLLHAAGHFAGRIIAGSEESPLELMRDELSGSQSKQRLGRELFRLQEAVALLLAMLSVGLWLRGNLYQDALVETQVDLAEVHQQLFPGKEVASNVRSAVDAEFRQLQATRSTDTGAPHSSDADTVLQRLLAAMPADLRFRLPEIQIERERISLGGEVRSNSDADKIADGLRQHGFTVESPKTQRLSDKGFSVRLSARTAVSTLAMKKNQ